MTVVGFDVSKNSLVAARINRSGVVTQQYQLSNTMDAVEPLLEQLRKRFRHLLVASEATADYHRTLAQACLRLSIPFRLLNPLLTKQFTRATVRKKKTDKTDAEVIARLALQGQGNLITSETFTDLQPLFRTSVKLVQMSQMVTLMRQHLDQVLSDPELDAQLIACTVALTTTAATFRQHLVDCANPGVAELLTSIPGVGVTTATALMAEIGDITRFRDAKALVAYAGLDPRKFQSGKTLNRSGHITKRGSPQLRRALYLSATVAKRCDPRFRALYDKKRSEGRKYREAMVVLARTQLRVVYAVWTTNTPYRPLETD